MSFACCKALSTLEFVSSNILLVVPFKLVRLNTSITFGCRISARLFFKFDSKLFISVS